MLSYSVHIYGCRHIQTLLRPYVAENISKNRIADGQKEVCVFNMRDPQILIDYLIIWKFGSYLFLVDKCLKLRPINHLPNSI